MANELAGTDHPSSIEVNEAGGLSGLTLWLRAQADGITLVQSDSGRLVIPADGGGEVALPASPAAGTQYDFAAPSADSPITIHAQGLHEILAGGFTGTTATSTAGGARLQLVYAANNAWVGLISGAWGIS